MQIFVYYTLTALPSSRHLQGARHNACIFKNGSMAGLKIIFTLTEWSAEAACVARYATQVSGNERVNVLPLPYSLSKLILPPSNSANFWLRCSPSPVPSLRRTLPST
jgi:hypothetical protein